MALAIRAFPFLGLSPSTPLRGILLKSLPLTRIPKRTPGFLYGFLPFGSTDSSLYPPPYMSNMRSIINRETGERHGPYPLPEANRRLIELVDSHYGVRFFMTNAPSASSAQRFIERGGNPAEVFI